LATDVVGAGATGLGVVVDADDATAVRLCDGGVAGVSSQGLTAPGAEVAVG